MILAERRKILVKRRKIRLKNYGIKPSMSNFSLFVSPFLNYNEYSMILKRLRTVKIRVMSGTEDPI